MRTSCTVSTRWNLSSDMLVVLWQADSDFPDFADCDGEAPARALMKGVSSHTPDRPAWYIHTSGTGILAWDDVRTLAWGSYSPKEYNDWDGIDELLNLPDYAPHRPVDKIVLAAGLGSPETVKTAIVCPPCIYGTGRGSGNTISIQAYRLAKAILRRKKGVVVGEGKNIWHEVHVQDLSNVYLALGEAAAAGGGNATWGKDGYYLAENGAFVWGDIQRAVAKVAYDKKLIPTPDVDIFEKATAKNFDQETQAMSRLFYFGVGSNSRGQAIRARKLLGWTPKQPGLVELLPEIVESQARDLGLVTEE
jgi:hypothetical protein